MAKNEKANASFMFDALKKSEGIVRKAHMDDGAKEKPQNTGEPKSSSETIPVVEAAAVEKTVMEPDNRKEVNREPVEEKTAGQPKKTKTVEENRKDSAEKQEMIKLSIRLEENLRNRVFQESLERSREENRSVSINEIIVEVLKKHYKC